MDTSAGSVKQYSIVQHRYGAPGEVLGEVASLRLPPGPREVQVEVKATSVNPIDWQMIEGNRRLISRRTFPYTPFFDLAGVVSSVGSGITDFTVGDRVYADNEIGGGGAALYVNVNRALLAHSPERLDLAEAAAVPLAAQTALTCLDVGEVAAGTRLAVIGASGGVGHFVVQMAHAAGAFVVGVASARNRDFVMGLGADEVVDRNATDLVTAYGDRSFDVVIDTAGGRSQWLQARRILRPGGKFVTISRDEDGVVTPMSAIWMASTISARRIRGAGRRGIKYSPVFLKASAELLQRVTTLIDDGKVTPHVAQVFPLTLEGVNRAIELSRTGRAVGKLVLAR